MDLEPFKASSAVDVKGFTPSPRSLSVRLAAAALKPLGR